MVFLGPCQQPPTPNPVYCISLSILSVVSLTRRKGVCPFCEGITDYLLCWGMLMVFEKDRNNFPRLVVVV